eukprot:4989426-Pyramimonas_sp.AAC.1
MQRLGPHCTHELEAVLPTTGCVLLVSPPPSLGQRRLLRARGYYTQRLLRARNVGFDDAMMNGAVNELSGGWRMKLAIACAMLQVRESTPRACQFTLHEEVKGSISNTNEATATPA